MAKLKYILKGVWAFVYTCSFLKDIQIIFSTVLGKNMKYASKLI